MVPVFFRPICEIKISPIHKYVQVGPTLSMKPPRQSKFNIKKGERYYLSSDIEIAAGKVVLKKQKNKYTCYKW